MHTNLICMSKAMAPLRKSSSMHGPPRKNGLPKRTWVEVVRIDMKKWKLSKDWLKIDPNEETKF